jgi:alpha-D-ribose 1-methylphosphonate 5-triphosphate synthase subunit PhnH
VRAFGPVLDSQRAYRALLRATANPGELCRLPSGSLKSCERALTTLLDHEISFCATGAGAREAAERLVSETGARIAPLREADFALILEHGAPGALRELRRGTLEAPERGATAVYAVRRLRPRWGPLVLSLSGPGVPGVRFVGVEGLTETEVENVRETRAGYPLGVDVYLVDREGGVLGLPRSTRVEVVG